MRVHDDSDSATTTDLIVDPTTTTEVRRNRSARRTSHIDILPSGEGPMMMAGFTLRGRSRDVLTTADGAAQVADEATIHAELAPGRMLRELTIEPDMASLGALVGLPVAGGFRAAVAETAGHHATEQTPLHTLLDDLPVASLIAGYADLYSRPSDHATAPGARTGPQADICAGWQSGGTMLSAIAGSGQIPIPVGPDAPPIERPGDELSWHAMDPLPRGAMRRRRLVDVTAREVIEIRAMFRDTHVDADGRETVLHEYELRVDADPTNLQVLAAAAVPRVLPWIECPQAVASAGRLIGHRLGTMRELVRKDFKGTSTCTHLNDLLRSIDDVVALHRLVTEHRPT